METQRQWSDLAILRTTPALLGLFSLVALWAGQLAQERGPAVECVRWYPKPLPTFGDALALIRRELWVAQVFTTSPAGRTRSEEHTSELQSRQYLVCRLLLVKKKREISPIHTM